ncbi:MAG: cysteine hydrolase [Rhizobiaceae bacterium]|nr:MAG: cysteine hydrolase [Rhizobiaceae bacterium]
MPLKYGPLSNAVHICVDMQRLFVEATPWQAPWAERVLPMVATLCEHQPDRLVFTRFVPMQDSDSAPGTWQRYYQRWPEMTLERLPPQLLDLAPPLDRFSPPALRFDKRVYSPWHDGTLAPYLTDRRVTTVVVSGLETEVCVLATVLGAIDCGFRVVIAMDAVCSSADETHDSMSRIYESRFGMQVEATTTAEIIEAWRET